MSSRQLAVTLMIVSCLASNYITEVVAVVVKIGARPSPLAQTQAKAVAEALSRASGSLATTSIVKIQTRGDHVGSIAGIQAVPLAAGGAIDFTSALDEALLSHDIDAAVHSLKDIPPTARWRQGLSIACHLPREVPHDVLVGPYASIDDLPQHAKVGTSSVRRQAQLLAKRSDLDLINLRGNIETRLGALSDGSVDALILAQAGLSRLLNEQKKSGNVRPMLEHPWNTIPSTDILSAACQGIVAVVCRTDDSETIDWLMKINDRDANLAAAAERAFLDTLDSFTPSSYQGSSIPWIGRPPLAAFLEKRSNAIPPQIQEWVFHGLLARPDGTKVIRDCVPFRADMSTAEAAKVGRELAEDILQRAGDHFYQP